MINNNIILLQNSSLFNFLQWTNSNIFNLPNEIKLSKQFCFWKYRFENSLSKKPLKIPYGYCNKKKALICSLKNSKYWLSFDKVVELQDHLAEDFKLGLVLNNGPFTVIDIDNYQEYEPLDILLVNMLKKGAYVEISPSGKGLHIFYRGTWEYKRNKGVNAIITNETHTTCEVYSGKDVRFITLTGQKLLGKGQKDVLLMASTFDLFNELSSLQKIFFDTLEGSKLSKVFDVKTSINLCNYNYARENHISRQYAKNVDELDFQELNQIYKSIKNTILDSDARLISKYSDLCHNINSCYNSISDADWSFCITVAAFIPTESSHKYQILEYFFQKDRPDRAKKSRVDYVKMTLQKALNCFSQQRANLNKSFSSPNSIAMKVAPVSNRYSIEQRQRLPGFKLKAESTILKSNDIDKNSVLKICNTMKIFHLGKSIRNFEYVNSHNNNYLKATIPVSLNQNDLVNYIAILEQFIYQMNLELDQSAKDNYFAINIKKILKITGKTSSGKSYQNFMNTVKKLSYITLEYDKQINAKGLRSEKVGSLLTYEYKYQNLGSLDDLNSYRKLLIRMHPSIVDIVQESNYNYSIFNKTSFFALETNELKLLYYYFCISTLPGSFSQIFAIDDLLKLWPESQNRQTMLKRKYALFNLLQKFCEKKDQILDLDATLEKNNGKIVGIKVKKNKLNMI